MIKPRIVLAEDHAVMRQVVERLLENIGDVVGVAQDGEEVIRLASNLQPDVVVLDISMPRVSGLTALPELRALLPDAILVILTTHTERAYEEEAFRRGADLYLSKVKAGGELLPAIANALSGVKANSRPA